ncbi:coiled-coil domain-containing protein 60 isoform X1 [Canis lupus baileyi]|uniref:coiled-coil domain-containing protein 60 isoform X1 n=1 Tax=Canis lupus baileyi TaxID=143281 RepID=UPI003B978A86
MTKIPPIKKMHSIPNGAAPFYASEHLTQVPDKPMRSIKYMDKEIINLKKDLTRSRMLIQSVKAGRGYFDMLREESALKKKQQQLQKLEEEERHKFQPAKRMSEIHYGELLLNTYDDEKVKKMGAGNVLRPFIPVHSCILSPSLPEAHVEPLFRQLCALHWLLEALTIDRTRHTMKPVITCWDPKFVCLFEHILVAVSPLGPNTQCSGPWNGTFCSRPRKILGVSSSEGKAHAKAPRPLLQEPHCTHKVEGGTSRDPGGSKNTIKKINKDKSIEQKWEHFVTAPKTKKPPVLRVTSGKPSWRGCTLSLSRTSGGSSPQSSMVSMNPGSDEPLSMITQATGSIEDNDSFSTKPDEELLHINLQKLLEMVREDAQRTVTLENRMQKKASSILPMIRQNKSDSTNKDIQTTHKSRSSSTSGESHTQIIQKKSKSCTNHDIIQCKSGVCSTMRAKFYGVAQEAGFCLQDKMEILMKRQEERVLQKFHSFNIVSNFEKDIAKMRHQASMIKGDAEEIADHWYFDLLSKLPEDLKNFRPAKKILAKLQKFGENLDLRIRPRVFLKVLQDLRIWELCSPDIAVAIEFVREHIIHMSQEDYINWLQNRINSPI